MTQRNDGEQAFPRAGFSGPVGFGKPEDGMSLRQYAAIKLRVPDSGTNWLDDMIRQSLRDELAGKAMHGDISRVGYYPRGEHMLRAAGSAYAMADAVLAARERP